MNFQDMIDTTGSALPGLLAALGNNFPAVLAGYVTGLDGVDWPAHSRATAEAFIAANPDVVGVQWASPSSNPDTILLQSRQ